jgi:hypothetical protein
MSRKRGGVATKETENCLQNTHKISRKTKAKANFRNQIFANKEIEKGGNGMP